MKEWKFRILAIFAFLYIFLGCWVFIRIMSEPRTLLDLILFMLFMTPALARVDKIFLGE